MSSAVIDESEENSRSRVDRSAEETFVMTATSSALGLARAVAAGIDPVGFFQRHAGDDHPFTVRFPGLGEVAFFGTEGAARDLFSAPASASRAPLPNPIEPVLGSGSLILMSGAEHRRERSLLMPAFHGDRIKSYAETFASATSEETSTLAPGASFPVYELAVRITLHVAIRVVFSVDDPDRRHEYSEAVTKLLRSNIAPLMLVPALRRSVAGRGPWARLLSLRDALDEMLTQDMAGRTDHVAAGPDMLDVLLRATDEEGRGRPATELHDQLRTLLAAGHETTASSLAWALYHIYRDDSVRDRLVSELAGCSSPMAMAGLPYLTAVIKESQRMHPPVPIVLRRLTTALNIDGVDCVEGQLVGIALYALHFNPSIWTDPHTFSPERFLGKRTSPFQFAPFGGGNRRCIGAAFAASELAVMIGTMLRTLELEMPAAERSAAPPRGVARGIAVAPSRDFDLRVVTRRDLPTPLSSADAPASPKPAHRAEPTGSVL
jgi:cytochrome P450 family 110